MMSGIRLGTIFAAGVICGAVAWAALRQSTPAMAQTNTSEPNLKSLVAEIEAIKGKLPDQAHAMQDVGYHFTNLWFAGQQGNWELANFYWLETRSHLRWAVRIIPRRKDNAGREVELDTILEALENGPLKNLEGAIAKKNREVFAKYYRDTLGGCYACHIASDKPFIRLQIPSKPDASIIDFEPKTQ